MKRSLGVLPHGSVRLVAGIARDMQKRTRPHLAQTRVAQRGEREYAGKALERPGRFDEAEVEQRIAIRHEAVRHIQLDCRLRSERTGTGTIAARRDAVPPRHRASRPAGPEHVKIMRRGEDDIGEDQKAGPDVGALIPEEVSHEMADGGVRTDGRVRHGRTPVHRPDHGIVRAFGQPIEQQRRTFFERAHTSGPAHDPLSPSP